MTLQERVVDFFKDLKFYEESHTYLLGDKRLKSVSTLISNFVEKQDFDKIAGFVSKREGVSKEEIIAEWRRKNEVAIASGKQTHAFAEGELDFPTTTKEEAIKKFLESIPNHYELLCMEQIMYHKTHLFCGTADRILLNKNTGKLLIIDYKTNRDLFNYFGNYLTGVFDFLMDCNFNKYQIQLSFYQILIEQLGLEIEERKIVWVKDDATYEVFNTFDYTDILKKWLVGQTFLWV